MVGMTELNNLFMGLCGGLPQQRPVHYQQQMMQQAQMEAMQREQAHQTGIFNKLLNQQRTMSKQVKSKVINTVEIRPKQDILLLKAGKVI